MENPGPIKDQIAKRIKEATNILVTVNSNPTVDQLAATIGLTLLLNKLGKHGTAVFSGAVPSTIEFLEPEKTLEKNTDSLRDFIISLDKSKADKLRYKVEDKLVSIFITPYQTSLTEKDLVFTQGDFNVDVVIALGVKQAQYLDQAIAQHGRILHDATVISLNTDASGDIGTMNWVDNGASSLCEMVASLVELMQDSQLLDGQMATALLTGIVSETARFSNSKTTPLTMNVSSRLMTAGANQQLISSKLHSAGLSPQPQANPSGAVTKPIKAQPDGVVSINNRQAVSTVADRVDTVTDKTPDASSGHIQISEHGTLAPIDKPLLPTSPGLNSQFAANQPHVYTLDDTEKSVHSSHQNAPEPESAPEPAPHSPAATVLDEARKAVAQVADNPHSTEASTALYEPPINLDQSHSSDNNIGVLPQVIVDEVTGLPNFGLPNSLTPSAQPIDTTKSSVSNPMPPPLVPPPMMPPTL